MTTESLSKSPKTNDYVDSSGLKQKNQVDNFMLQMCKKSEAEIMLNAKFQKDDDVVTPLYEDCKAITCNSQLAWLNILKQSSNTSTEKSSLSSKGTSEHVFEESMSFLSNSINNNSVKEKITSRDTSIETHSPPQNVPGLSRLNLDLLEGKWDETLPCNSSGSSSSRSSCSSKGNSPTPLHLVMNVNRDRKYCKIPRV
jgi:hypothetical protein